MGYRLRAALFIIVLLFCHSVQADEEESLPIAPQNMDGFSGVIQEPFAPDATEAPLPAPSASPAVATAPAKSQPPAKPVAVKRPATKKVAKRFVKPGKRAPSQVIRRVSPKKKAPIKKKSHKR